MWLRINDCSKKNAGFKCFSCNIYVHERNECNNRVVSKFSYKIFKVNFDSLKYMQKKVNIVNLYVSGLVDKGSLTATIRKYIYDKVSF